jgi:WD40 repeat protein
MRHGIWVIGFGVFAALGQAVDPPAKAYLRIETGMHTAQVRSIDLDVGVRFLVTGSYDKTARVWDAQTGALLKILRPPQGDGDDGQLYAVAISPDGATVAVGGWSRSDQDGSIYLFDRESGALRRRIAVPRNVNHLSYSRNGKYFAAALGGTTGIRVYRTSDYQEAGRDSDYGDSSYWVDFDPAGRLVSTSGDGLIRLYSATFRLLAKKRTPAGKLPFGARFSPDGSKIAVGYDDSAAVSVLSASDLSMLYAPDTSRAKFGNLVVVAWSLDGKTLFAAGTHADSSRMCPIFSWRDAGRGSVRPWYAAWNTVMDLRALPLGRLAFGAQDPAVGVLDSKRALLWRHTPDIPDHRNTQWRFHIEPEKRCYARMELAASLYLAGDAERAKDQFTQASSDCGTRLRGVQAVVGSEIERVGRERSELAERAGEARKFILGK